MCTHVSIESTIAHLHRKYKVTPPSSYKTTPSSYTNYLYYSFYTTCTLLPINLNVKIILYSFWTLAISVLQCIVYMYHTCYMHKLNVITCTCTCTYISTVCSTQDASRLHTILFGDFICWISLAGDSADDGLRALFDL